MPPLSFKVKVLLAMMLVVVGVTGATLYASQRKYQEGYRTIHSELFQIQNQAFLSEQQRVFEGIKQHCLYLSGKGRVRDALSVTDVDVEELYRRVRSELVNRGMLPQPGEEPNPRHVSLYLFLDAKGRFLFPTKEPFSGAKPFASQARLKEQLALAGAALAKSDGPVLAYLTSEAENGHLDIHQFVIVKVKEPDSDDSVGAFGLAFQMPPLGGEGREQSKAGIFFEGRLLSESIPEGQWSVLAKRLAEEIEESAQPRENFVEEVQGEPHRVFYQVLNQDSSLPKAYLVVFLSLKKALATQRNLRNLILGLGGLGLVGAATVGLLLAHGLTGPIRSLVSGTVEIQKGNFQVKVPVRSRDELGHLATSFNEMTEGLAQREKFRSVLNMVSDKDVAQALMQGTLALGGETRQVSVLFCDIRGFTALTQGMDPAEVIRMLNEHFTPLTRVVNEHQGVVDKFVGDLIMAVFGAPKSYGNDIQNAASCALAMLRERAQLNVTSRYQIQVGIGVASGPAVAGCMGSSDRLNYTVLGERVNLASRLCSKAGRMEVVIDQTTFERLKDCARVETMGELDLKGFSSRVQAYKLLDIAPAPTLANV